jgi:FKBP-type peptidyl-prolyl cis-trans isomerase
MADMRKLSTTTLQLFLTGALLTTCALAQSGSTSAQAPATQTAPAAAGQQGSTPATTGQQSAPPPTPVIAGLPTKKDQVSYAIGMNIGKGLHHESIDVDPNMVLSGLKDALAGGKTLMTDEQAQQTLAQLQAEVRQAAEAKRQQEGEANKKAGDAFLAANKTKPGVVTLPSGLQYKIIKQGTGPKPTINDTVTVTYRGTTIDGKEFDSTAQHGGEPATFPVKGIIRGWTEALQLMPAGSKFELYLPPDLAYGERGVGNDIGPNSTLIFDVDLISVKPAETPQEQKPSSEQQPPTQQNPATSKPATPPSHQ